MEGTKSTGESPGWVPMEGASYGGGDPCTFQEWSKWMGVRLLLAVTVGLEAHISGNPAIIQDLNDPWMEIFVVSRKCVSKEDSCILNDRPGTKDEYLDEMDVEVNELSKRFI